MGSLQSPLKLSQESPVFILPDAMSERERAWELTRKAGEREKSDVTRRGGTVPWWDWPNHNLSQKTWASKDQSLTFLAFSKYILYLSSIAFISSSFFWRAASSSLIFCAVIEKEMKHDQFKILHTKIVFVIFFSKDW